MHVKKAMKRRISMKPAITPSKLTLFLERCPVGKPATKSGMRSSSRLISESACLTYEVIGVIIVAGYEGVVFSDQI